MGNVWGVLGDARKAVSYYERALAIKEQVHKEVPNHPEIAGALNNLGLAWQVLGDVRKAVSYYERALATSGASIQESAQSPRDRYNFDRFGECLASFRGCAQSGELLRARFSNSGANVPRKRPITQMIASILNNLGAAWRALGDGRTKQ